MTFEKANNIIDEVKTDMFKVKRMVTDVEMVIGKREGESKLVNKLIDAENLLTYCMSRLENAIVPPCRLNQTLWWKRSWDNCIEKCKVSSLTQKADGTFKIRITLSSGDVFEITPDEIGKTVFHSQEEAEK